MTYFVLIDKYGKVTEKNFKQYDEAKLYSKAGFKKDKDFELLHIWKSVEVDNRVFSQIKMFGKLRGNAGMENKYEFPPPMDTKLCFGAIVLVHKTDNDEPMDLRKEDWLKLYDHLYGGFEDTNQKDDEEEEEEEIEAEQLTKQGYKKDDFVVDDDEEEEDGEFEYESELSEDDYFD
jgi:hypothetical protein